VAKATSLCVLLVAATLQGCATTGGNPADPLEPLNRAMFSFNDTLDEAVMKPVAKGYRFVLPGMVRTGVSNFFSNVDDVWISINQVLQGKLLLGLGDFGRFLFNSTVGVVGLFDFASEVGLPKHSEDFGQTLAWWGVGGGPYVVLPILGPSTVRDGLAFIVDAEIDPVWRIGDVSVRNTAVSIRFIGRRAELLDISNVLEQAALDRYALLRDAWLQRRRSLIYDGDPPREKEDFDDDSR
jgi:phospholipid-binding lipoprotein MlaA